jgi:hypothetical protein
MEREYCDLIMTDIVDECFLAGGECNQVIG